MKRLFLDTNILLDAMFNRGEFAKDAKSLLALCLSGKIELCISALSIVNAMYISKKYAMTIEEAKKKLLTYTEFIEVVDMLSTDVVGLLSGDWKDYEDSVQNAAAINISADYIITRNKGDFKKSSIPVLTDREFLLDFFEELV